MAAAPPQHMETGALVGGRKPRGISPCQFPSEDGSTLPKSKPPLVRAAARSCHRTWEDGASQLGSVNIQESLVACGQWLCVCPVSSPLHGISVLFCSVHSPLKISISALDTWSLLCFSVAEVSVTSPSSAILDLSEVCTNKTGILTLSESPRQDSGL